jgi:hypothetical protein
MKAKKPPLGKKNECIFLGILLFIVVAVVSSSDQQDEIDQQAHYCEMVKLWNGNKHLSKEDRPGWPPYNGEEQCHED